MTVLFASRNNSSERNGVQEQEGANCDPYKATNYDAVPRGDPQVPERKMGVGHECGVILVRLWGL